MMATSSLLIAEHVQAEAERWFAQLMAPDCPPTEYQAFQTWLQADPVHRQAYGRVERLWERLGDAVQLPQVKALPEAASLPPAVPLSALVFKPRVPHGQRRWPVRAAWTAGLAACLAAAVGLVHLGSRTPPPQIFQSATGESRSMTLADGSVVTLDTDSRIEVAFEGRRRAVTLRQGAAFFDVTPDAARPFVVVTPVGTATVLGTQFQVRSVGDNVQVLLVKGALRLDDSENEDARDSGVILSPGQQATRSSHSTWQVAAADLSSTAWREGRLVFRDTSLQQAVDEVNRYTHQKLRIGDPALAQMTVSGVFRIGDPYSFVLVLENTLPVRDQPAGDERVLLRK